MFYLSIQSWGTFSPVVSAAALLFFSPGARAAAVSSVPAQTFLGIGGSGAWWPMDLYNFPESTRQNLSSLLFSQEGLGLTSYRWNVGGGGVDVANPVRAPETFYVSPGVYNWSADPQGIYFLREASKYGVPSLTAFVNSAPAAMTSSGGSCDGSFVNGTGIEYGTYLADVIAHVREEGMSIKYISPMNEPDNNFGPAPCGQEGMEVDANQRAEVINGLYSALESKGLEQTVGIIADESSSLSNAMSEYSVWLPQVVDKVAALVHHVYDFASDATYTSFHNLTSTLYPGKATWMSEICCSLGQANGVGRGYSGGYDPTITNALMWSGMLFQSFLIANEPHYDFWTLASNAIGCSPLGDPTCATTPNAEGWTDGVIYYDGEYATNGNYELYIPKHFWTYKHFGNFVKPGSQRRPITGSDAPSTAMAVSAGNTYHIIAMNPNATDSSLTLTFSDTVCAETAYRTSATEDFVEVSGAEHERTGWVLPLKAMSLTTFAFESC